MVTPKKILLVDDHSIVRMALTTLAKELYPDAIVDEAIDGHSAMELVNKNEYFIVIMDIQMPDTDSFSLVKKMIELKPAIKILVFSMHTEKVYAKHLLKAGAMGYVRKDQPASLVKKAIMKVASNELYLSDTLIEDLAYESLTGVNSNPFETLSTRELEILKLLVRGKSVQQIAAVLAIHTSTVGTHKARIFTKLGVSNIVEIGTLAKANNMDLGVGNTA